MYFKRLNATLELPDKFDVQLSHQYPHSGGALKYYNLRGGDVASAVARALSRVFIKQLTPSITYATLSGTAVFPPHFDDGPNTAINFYLRTNEERTVFYSRKHGAIPYRLTPAHIDNLYHKEDLVEQYSFAASTGDCYLLNVAEVHAIESVDVDHINRSFISCYFSEPYDVVVSNLRG